MHFDILAESGEGLKLVGKVAPRDPETRLFEHKTQPKPQSEQQPPDQREPANR